MKNQTFGVEIELTGITRRKASQVIANYFGTEIFYIGTYYDAYGAKDNKGRTWKAMHDGSIRQEGGQAVEIVTPILRYEDIEDLQEIVRQLRHKGAKANETCGIHIHISAEKHTANTLANLVNIMTSKQNLIYKALDIKNSRERYCKKLKPEIADKIRKKKPDSLEKIADIWYDGYTGNRNDHYNISRYHCLNLHSVFTKGTVEFRLCSTAPRTPEKLRHTYNSASQSIIRHSLRSPHQHALPKPQTRNTPSEHGF